MRIRSAAANRPPISRASCGAILRAARCLPAASPHLPPVRCTSAVWSWLFARRAGGRWLVRMEDLDTPRVVAESADEILRALERYGLTWDGDVVYQSQRIALYDEALSALRAKDL